MAKGSLLGFFFFRNTLLSGLATVEKAIHLTLDARLENLAKDMEAYAKENAPWEDQTGDARQGLTAETFKDGFVHGVILYHTVDYGIWLEIRYSGTYAIIMPTIEHFASEVFVGMRMEGSANGADEGVIGGGGDDE